MEKIYTMFDQLYVNSNINTENSTINLTGLALAVLTTGTIISLMAMLFAR